MTTFTVITPTVVRESLLRTCRSLDTQSYRHWQHLVMVDKPESALTAEEKRRLAGLCDPRRDIRYCAEPHHDFGNTCRWNAWDFVTGDYVLYLDDDDYHVSETLAVLAQEIAALPSPPIWGIFPILRHGRLFFNVPPGHSLTCSNQFFHRPRVDGRELRYPQAGYCADGTFIDSLRESYPYARIDPGGPLAVVERSHFGAREIVMRLGIVMPVILQQQELLDLTRDAVSHLRTTHAARLYVVCNGLHLCTAEELQADLQSRFDGEVAIISEPGIVRSVAGSWNAGTALALADGADYVVAIANDARLRDDCLDVMVAFGERGGADLWSGISDNDRPEIDASAVTDGADFTCFMFRRATIERFGWFDPNFKPAYFEDNDYYARVVLGGGECRVVHAAQFYHHGSMTIRHDPAAAHHVNYWFGRNQAYFARKWGVSQPGGSRDEVVSRYYLHPFNDPERTLSWFPDDGNP
jgi:hypothetical protein